MNQYQQIAEWVLANLDSNQKHQAFALLDIMHDLHQGKKSEDLEEALGVLDSDRSTLASEALKHFQEHGETYEFVDAYRLLPPVWDKPE